MKFGTLKKENKMRKSIFVTILALVAITAGCTTGTHLTFGPLHGQADATTHKDLQKPTFYFAQEKPEGLCTGSSLLWWSSEVCGQWRKCNELSFGLFVNWEQTPPAPEPTPPAPTT